MKQRAVGHDSRIMHSQAHDAEEMAKTLEAKSGSYFKQVFTKVLTDNTEARPDAATILEALEFVRQGRPADTVITFSVPHGISDAAGYNFVSGDVLRRICEHSARGKRPFHSSPRRFS